MESWEFRMCMNRAYEDELITKEENRLMSWCLVGDCDLPKEKVERILNIVNKWAYNNSIKCVLDDKAKEFIKKILG